MQADQLRALLAIVDTGTFEAAARALGITPSAVSQRVKALESRLGRLVVRRTQPCRPTEAGQVLVRMARELAVLEADALAELDPGGAAPADLAVAVNADSLSTWFLPVLATVAGWADTALRLHVEDEQHSAALLRGGDVIGAVTSDPVAIQGCSIRPLGTMRYLPMATAALRDAHLRDGVVDWSAIPVVRFNAKDVLQHEFLTARGVMASRAVHQVPSSEGFLAAVRAGLGWGMVPARQLEEADRGRLVRLSGREHVDVALYWQSWRLRSPRIERFTDALVGAAREGLR